jgi:hypothetical protein
VMWWDLAEITLLDSILFALLSIATMYFVGFGVLSLISKLTKKTDPLREFDFSKRINFRIFFGFVFIFLFLYLLSVFNIHFLITTIIIVSIAATGLIVSHMNMEIRLSKTNFFKKHLDTLIVFAVVAATLLSTATIVTGYYGSTIDDGADHTLMTRIVLDNPNAIITRSTQPYANIPLNYPVATHALSAFLVTLFVVPIEKIIIMLSVILPALIAISFYSTIKCLFENKFLSVMGLVIAAFFATGLTWVPVAWGGLPYLLSLYISITSLGLIYTFIIKKKWTPLNALLIGLIFFIASRTYPIALLIVTLWFSLILIAKLIPKARNIQRESLSIKSIVNRTNVGIAIAFVIPILLSVPYFSFIFTQNIAVITSNNLDSVSNSAAEAVKAQIGFNWLLDIPALSHFFSSFGTLFLLTPFSIIPMLLLFIPKISQKIALHLDLKEFRRSLSLVYLFMLLIMSYLTVTLYLPINFLTSFLNPERVWQHLFIPAIIMATVVLFSCGHLFYLPLKRLFNSGKTKPAKLKRRTLSFALLILIISGAFITNGPIIHDQQTGFNEAKFMINKFQVLNQSDISLMNWIKENVPSNGSILVSSGDSGQFLTSVTQRQSVSYYSRYQNYSYLMAVLTSNASDLRAVPFMIKYNVTYVYMGSIATSYALQLPYYRHFSSTQFLSTPYFMLAKQVGDSWIFQFNASAASAAYNAAGPLPEFVDQLPHPSTYINILTSEGGYTDPPTGIYYGSGVQTIYAFANEGYKLDHWILNGSYLSGPVDSVNVNYWNWNLQAIFTKKI